jgi:DNA-directed RNA polymerase subunit RPC12/RpoP
MCRYGMITYKPHYACFACRKTFKRRLLQDMERDETEAVAAKCPECGALTANMGLDFKSPPRNDARAWQHLRNLYAVGITYHSCGCSGPGYIPATTEALVVYLEERLQYYVGQLRYWLNRPEPASKAEAERDKSQNWEYNSRLPGELKGKKGSIRSNEAAIAYWSQQVQGLAHDLSKVKMQVPV